MFKTLISRVDCLRLQICQWQLRTLITKGKSQTIQTCKQTIRIKISWDKALSILALKRIFKTLMSKGCPHTVQICKQTSKIQIRTDKALSILAFRRILKTLTSKGNLISMLTNNKTLKIKALKSLNDRTSFQMNNINKKEIIYNPMFHYLNKIINNKSYQRWIARGCLHSHQKVNKQTKRWPKPTNGPICKSFWWVNNSFLLIV